MDIIAKLKKFIKPYSTKNSSSGYTLSNRDIQSIIDEIDSKLSELRYERLNAIRIRLSAEECLLRWRDHLLKCHLKNLAS